MERAIHVFGATAGSRVRRAAIVVVLLLLLGPGCATTSPMANAEGGVPWETVRKVLDAHWNKFTYCSRCEPEGKVSMVFTIGETGRVNVQEHPTKRLHPPPRTIDRGRAACPLARRGRARY